MTERDDEVQRQRLEMNNLGTFVSGFTALEHIVDAIIYEELSALEEKRRWIVVHEISAKMGFVDRLNLLVEISRTNEDTTTVKFFKDVVRKVCGKDGLAEFRNLILHKPIVGVPGENDAYIPSSKRDEAGKTQIKTSSFDAISYEQIGRRAIELLDLYDHLFKYKSNMTEASE